MKGSQKTFENDITYDLKNHDFSKFLIWNAF